jgi:O-antigen/teichoic acid export membrane protein
MSATPGINRSPQPKTAPTHPNGPPAEAEPLRGLVVRGAFWTVFSYGASQVLRLGGNLVLTRLLAPELFGLMALVHSVRAGLTLFSDIGAGRSIVRHPSGEEAAFRNTAWTLQILRGIWLSTAAALIAWPVARFYGDPRLLSLLPLVGVTSVIAGFNSTNLFVLNRRLALDRLVRFEVGSQALGLLVTLLLVWIHPTVWSLAYGGLAGAAVRMVWSHRLDPTLPARLAWDRTALAELLSFGKWIFLSTALTFLAEQSDRLILGKLLPLEVLGIYGIAAMLADVPRQIGIALSRQVIFPAVSRLIALPRDELRARIMKGRRPALIGSALGVAAAVTCGDAFVRLLYDPRYESAAWMVPVLALGIWPRVVCNTIEPALLSLGRPQYATLANVLRFLWTAIGIPLAFARLGLPGVILVVALNDLPYYAVVLWGLRRQGLAATRQDLAATALFLATLAAAVSVRAALGFGTPLDPMSREFVR